MRIVIAVVVVTLYILWQQLYDDWQTTQAITREVSRVWNMIF